MIEDLPNAETPQRKSWWVRHRIWVISLAVLVPVVCVGIIAAITFFVMGVIKSSEPYTRSLQIVQADAEVQAALGTPIESSWLVMGSVHMDYGRRSTTGDADITYGVSGPNGEGDVHAVAQCDNNVWTFSLVAVDVDGQLIDVTPGAE